MENQEILQEEESHLLMLTDEDGVETEFEYLDCVEYNGTEYLILTPTGEDAGHIIILEIESVDEENENYVSVDDEAVEYAVYEIFKDRYKDIIPFAD